MIAASYPLQTARLALRPFTPADLDDLFAYMSCPDVVRYLYADVKDRAEAESTLQQWTAATRLSQDGDRLVLAVELPRLRRVIGEVVLKLYSRVHRQAELGYVFHPHFHGQGYASEAAQAMLALGFGQFGFHRIFARCDARNTGSYKVMQRLGMRREAHFVHNEFFKGEWGDELWYAILQTEWSERVTGSS